MAITVTKGKVKPKPTSEAPQIEVLEPEKLSDEELVDQYGRLQDQVLALKANPVFTQLELVTKELKERLSKHEPDEIITIIASDYELEAGACKLEARHITDPLKVLKWIGQEAFAKIAKVGVVDAEKYLVPDQFAQVVSTPGFTTNRTITVKYLGGNKKAK